MRIKPLLYFKQILCRSEQLRYLSKTIMSNNTISKKPTKHKIAICQLTSTDDKESNLNICKTLVENAKNDGAEMIFFPESFDYIESSNKATLEKSEELNGNLMNIYRDIARQNQVWLSLGGFHKRVYENGSGLKMYNSHIIIDAQGEIKQVYDKLHLFEVYLKQQNTVMKESDCVSYGKEFNMPIETPIGTLATLICYDLRFPQQSTLLRKLGAQILTYPSAFTKVTGEAHWTTLLRTRAIENQCYVIAAAQVGKHNERRWSYGHASVIDPWGKVIVDLEEKSPHFEIVEIDLDYLDEIRQNMPVLNSFRDDVYLTMPTTRVAINDTAKYTFGNIAIPSGVVFYETSYSFACVNIKPVVVGHAMVIPKRIRERVVDMTHEEASDLILTSRLIGTKLEKHLNCTSINYSIQDGPEAGQSIKHVHLHILPRKVGDFARNDDIYEKLQNHDKDMSQGLRSLEEMVKEANEFRKLFDTKST